MDAFRHTCTHLRRRTQNRKAHGDALAKPTRPPQSVTLRLENVSKLSGFICIHIEIYTMTDNAEIHVDATRETIMCVRPFNLIWNKSSNKS